jgi:VWFA-related protein
MTSRLTRLLTTAGCVAALGAHASLQQAPQQVPGAIRSRITLVPLDVRVLDRDGRPVTDLRQDEFVVLEDGVPQKIGHFALQQLTAEAPGPARPSLRKALDATVEGQRHRTFLIVLGRGRLQYPSRGYDGVMRFVRDQLLPQDKVALAAWNRTTDFTTDHAKLLPLLTDLREAHEKIESQMRHRESDLEGMLGSKHIAPRIQTVIDAIFEKHPDLRPRELASLKIRDQQGYDSAMQRETEAMMERMTGEGGALIDPYIDAFFRQAFVGQQTLATLYASIEYLKYFDGEKHLILLNEGGIYLPRADDDEGLAATAADARVAVHTVLTGGVNPSLAAMKSASELRADQRVIGSSGPLKSAFDEAVMSSGPLSSLSPMFAAGTMRTFSQLSGGYYTGHQMAAAAFDRIDRATRSQYVLGYYPASSNWDGDYRRIEVRVQRPGVTVSFRRGYFATDQLVPFDRRRFLTHSRISTAGYYSRPINDIKVTMKAAIAANEVIVQGTIDPSRLTLEPIDGVRGGEVDLAIFVGDRHEEIVGEQWSKVSLKLGEARLRDGRPIPFVVRIPVKGQPHYVKAIVYDYAADLVGSTSVRFR